MDLPPEGTLRSVVRSYAEVRNTLGAAAAPYRLVQPDSEFFPDEFRHDGPSLQRLLDRMASYAPIGDHVKLDIGLLDDEGDACGAGRSCGCGGDSGAGERSGRIEASPGAYRVWLQARDVTRAETLTTVFARAVGAVVLHESAAAADLGLSEVAAVACGFGVLLLNGAAIWGKSCGGLRMTRATVLGVEQLAIAQALFSALHGVRSSAVRRHLGTTQRTAFDVAHDWTESNPMLVEALRDRPAILESGGFELEPIRGPIGRWLYKRRLEQQLKTVPEPRPHAPMTEDQRRRIAEARALVDEVLGAADSRE
ncbi:MAG: hypothetical protein ABTD50_01685 [Polyangiaceae bacterium]|jgi:hypothetical protein